MRVGWTAWGIGKKSRQQMNHLFVRQIFINPDNNELRFELYDDTKILKIEFQSYKIKIQQANSILFETTHPAKKAWPEELNIALNNAISHIRNKVNIQTSNISSWADFLTQRINHTKEIKTHIKLYEEKGDIQGALMAFKSYEELERSVNLIGSSISIEGSVKDFLDNNDLSTEKRTEGSLNSQIASIKKNIDTAIQATETELVNKLIALENKAKSNRSKIEESVSSMDIVLNNAIKRVDLTEENIINTLTKEKNSLSSKIAVLNNELNQEHQKSLEQYQEYFTEFSKLSENSNNLISELQQELETAKILNQSKSEKILADHFNEESKSSYQSYIFWARATMAIGILLMVTLALFTLSIDGFLGTSSREMPFSWPSFFVKLSFTAVSGFVLGFCARQATRQKNNSTYFKRMFIELTTLDAYLSPYPKEEMLIIKKEMLKSYFGQALIAPTQEELQQWQSPTANQTLSTILKPQEKASQSDKPSLLPSENGAKETPKT